jgi:hypothetical protein
MPLTCKAFSTEAEAQEAVDDLLATGMPQGEIRVLMGQAVQDRRDARTGAFAGGGAATVGAFTGRPHPLRDGMGGFAGDPARQREGSFVDLDRDTVTTYDDGVARIHVSSHRNLEQLLVDAGLDEDAARADVDALHHGRILVLVRSEPVATPGAPGPARA